MVARTPLRCARPQERDGKNDLPPPTKLTELHSCGFGEARADRTTDPDRPSPAR